MAMNDNLLFVQNVSDHTVTELIVISVGMLLWLIAYSVIAYRSFKNKYVEMPYMAGAANLAWEFVWGFCLNDSLSIYYLWGVRVWFGIDLFIFYNLIRFGNKQIQNPTWTKYFKPLLFISFFAWVAMFYTYVKSLEAVGSSVSTADTRSAYVITVIMAVIYMRNYILSPVKSYFSYSVAWMITIANALIAAFVILEKSGDYFAVCLAIMASILNIPYVVLYKKPQLVSV